MFLPTEKTHDLARNTLVKELDATGAFKNGSQKYYGRLQSSYGYGKQIGTQSLDGKVRWRLDYDEKIGVHCNIEDFSEGKEVNAIKKLSLLIFHMMNIKVLLIHGIRKGVMNNE